MKRCLKLTAQQKEELNGIIGKGQSSGREVRRAQTILMLDANTPIETMKALTGYSRRQAFDLRRNYLTGGLTSILDKKKGKPKELLTRKQREEITNILNQKIPKDFSYDCDYWTTGIIADLVEERYNVRYKSKTSLYVIFRRARFSYHKPGKVYQRRDEKEVAEWKEQAAAVIGKAWKKENTVVLAEDEMVLSTQTTFQKIWLPQGEYPKIEVSNKKENRSIYGFLNLKTGKEHAFKTKWQNMYITVKVLKKIRKIYPDQKILIVWDGAGWHRGSKVQEFVREDKKIETFHFPRYSPEENPQEHVWKAGRSHVTHNHFIKDIDKTANQFVAYLNSEKFSYALLDFSAGS